MEMSIEVVGLDALQISDKIKELEDFGATRVQIGMPGDSPEEQTESMKRVADVLHERWLD